MAKHLAKMFTGDGAVKPLNVMFFVEPFPIRCRPLDYSWILHKWKATAEGLRRRGHRATFVTSDAVARVSRDLPGDVHSPSTMGIPTPCYPSWEACDAAWCELMRDPDVQPWRSFIARAFDVTQPDIIVSWTYNAPLRAEAAARGKLVVHTELGPVRAPHCRFYYFDPSGYNSDAVLEQVWPSFRDRALSWEQQWQVNTLLRDFIVRPDDAQAKKERLTPYGKPLLIYFLQVRRDCNILRWAPAGNAQEMLSRVKSAVDPKKFTLLVKPHPGEPQGAELVRKMGMTLAPKHIPTATLTSACDLVLTCNSAVGFEALCQGKIVYTLGQSVYADRGITRDFASRPDALQETLLRETFIPTADEIALRERFLHFMFFRYLVPERSFWDPDAMAMRLEHWTTLTADASPVDFYQEAHGMAVLHELRATAAQDKLEKRVEQLTTAQANLADLKLNLERAQARLHLLENSAIQRAAEQARALPGIQAFYVGAKQVVGKLKPLRLPGTVSESRDSP